MEPWDNNTVICVSIHGPSFLRQVTKPKKWQWAISCKDAEHYGKIRAVTPTDSYDDADENKGKSSPCHIN
jgi:hypothetical protein